MLKKIKVMCNKCQDCRVLDINGLLILTSYNSIVGLIDGNEILLLDGKYNYSITTKKHVTQMLWLKNYKEVEKRIKQGFIKVTNDKLFYDVLSQKIKFYG